MALTTDLKYLYLKLKILSFLFVTITTAVYVVDF